MSLPRDVLEKTALEAVIADDYYELLDCISEMSDDDLQTIIDDNQKGESS